MNAPSDPRLLHKTREEVRDALHELCDEQIRSVWREDGTVTRHKGLSLLAQLRDEVVNTTSRGGRRRASNASPLGVDALDLWNKIGDGMTMLVHEFHTTPDRDGVEAGLRAVVASAGQSTDLEALLGLRGFLRAWVNSIRTLLDPPKKVPLWGHACPVEVCGERTVWRVDESDGELKRAAALEAGLEEAMEETPDGDQVVRDMRVREIRCLACGEEWARSKVFFLARLLGCELPGVEHDETGEPAA